MKEYSQVQYEFFQNIEDDSNLAKLLNRVFKSMRFAKMISAPRVFADLRDYRNEEDTPIKSALMFKQLCLAEIYFHSVIYNLYRWKELLAKYNGEFESSWRYYAVADRMDMINKYGRDESDYTEDGKEKTLFSDEDLEYNTIIYNLVPEDHTDIFTQTEYDDLNFIVNLIKVDSSFSIVDIVQSISGQKISTYREENGKMIENDWIDESAQKAFNQINADEIVGLFSVAMVEIRTIIDEVYDLYPFNDNKDYLQYLPSKIDSIINLDFNI